MCDIRRAPYSGVWYAGGKLDLELGVEACVVGCQVSRMWAKNLILNFNSMFRVMGKFVFADFTGRGVGWWILEDGAVERR